MVIIPKNAITHIQNTAPGPPVTTAEATPAMFPVPTVDASAAHTLWNWDICLSLVCAVTLRSLNTAPMVHLNHLPMWDIWKNLVRTDISTPTKSSSISAGQPHTTLLIASFTVLTTPRKPFSSAAAEISIKFICIATPENRFTDNNLFYYTLFRRKLQIQRYGILHKFSW